MTHAAADGSVCVGHEPCPSCGSRDNLARYSDGHGYCFGCQRHEPGTQEGQATTAAAPAKRIAGLLEKQYRDLPTRGLTEATCRMFGYGVNEERGVHVCSYPGPNGGEVAQKLRAPGKKFSWIGDRKAAPQLYGQWLWGVGKMIVITEGEIDALTVSQLQKNRWPVVSVPDGAAGAAKAVQRNLEFVEGFETVVLMFDMDEPGQAAAKEVAELLTPGKAKIAKLPLKDANEMLVAGRGDEVINAIWRATPYRPDGILDGSELWELITSEETRESVDYPWEAVNALTLGMRRGEIVTLTAGTGIGKSQVAREIAYNLLRNGQRVGIVALEESVKHTALSLMSIAASRRLHIYPDAVTEEERRAAFDQTVGSGRCFLYDHWGSLESATLLARIRSMAKQCSVGWVVLDHISIAISGTESSNERKDIDVLMTRLRSLVEQTGIGLLLVSHLKRPDGKGHEDGAETSLSQLRGSAAIGQLSDMVIGLERDQQATTSRHITKVRVLKNRFTGETGLAGALYFNVDTGRLTQCKDLPSDAPNGVEKADF